MTCTLCKHEACDRPGSARCLRLLLSPPELHTWSTYALGLLANVLFYAAWFA